MVEQIETLLDYLAMYGGKIVCTSSLDVNDINQARASKRMYVDQVAIGYVWIPNLIKMPENEEEVAFFEKWYPLEIEIPDKDAMFNRIINSCKATKGGRQKFYNSNRNNVSKKHQIQKLNLPQVSKCEVIKRMPSVCPNCETDTLITLSDGIYCMNDCCDYYKAN